MFIPNYAEKHTFKACIVSPPLQQTVKYLLGKSLAWLDNNRKFALSKALDGEKLIKYDVLKPKVPLEIAVGQSNEGT